MSEKPPLSDSEIYDALHNAWLMLASEAGATEFGNNTLKAARLSLFTLQMTLMMKMEGATDQMPSVPSPHSD
ncbi:hypothetical protein HGP14_09645 [Rhizobium sp. P32RR-XVIII]|uniref:hypothetical protein n=1 Tax=Rhizobium sp. P32RR-XVIII TaxID=2726738 RepID=UPI001456D6DB|nr:hypothetical protein [Rhizobium sp. P32RR-XVIII]NLS03621.1 hypothetical protein [Rhizobium sp. P32RR-XVIII]